MYHNLIREISEKVQGLENLVLAGLDAIIVSRYCENEFDDLIVAEAVSLIREAQHFGNEMGSGGLMSFSTHFLGKVIYIQMVTQEYFLLGMTTKASFIPAVRYQFKLKAYEWYSAIA